MRQEGKIIRQTTKIEDIAFTQNGKKASLKSVLPGNYTIELKRSEDRYAGGHAHFAENYLTLDEPEAPDTTGETNLTLLHEAGHLVDYAHNRSLYQPLERMIWLADAKKSLIRARKFALTEEGSSLPEEDIQSTRTELEEGRKRFTPEEFQEIVQEFDQAVAQIGANTSFDDLSRMEIEQHQLKIEAGAKAATSKERNAWAHALKAMRQLSAQGISVFTSTKDELHRLIDGSLGSYELNYKLLLRGAGSSTPPPRFIKKRI